MKLKDIKCGETFTYKGYKFTKLADEKNSCYCLLNDTVFESEYGKTNDWTKSPIRKRLNEFDKNGNSIVLPKINKNELVAVSLNYTAYKLPNGRVKDYLTILSYGEYMAYSFPTVKRITWLRSGYYSYTWGVRALTVAGGYDFFSTDNWLSVRPALHLKTDLEIGR